MRTTILTDAIRGPVRVAAKAGFLTKPIWIKFFARGEKRWQNRQWKALMDRGLFRPVPDYGFRETAVTLTEKGKNFALALGLSPVYAPHSKNLWHDEELIKLVLFLELQGWISKWATEQELKIGDVGKKLFPNTGRPPKIPDLVIEWNGSKDKILWAIELERTAKEHTRYYDMVGAYKGISRFDSVLVIVASDAIEENIKRAQGKLNYPQAQRPMLFTSLDQVTEYPASCEIRMNQRRTTLSKIAQGLVDNHVMKSADKAKSDGPGNSPGGAIERRSA